MPETELLQLGLGVVVAICAAAAIYFVIAPLLSRDTSCKQRLQGVTDNKGARNQRRVQVDQAQSRRKQVSDTLKELEQRQKTRETVSLRVKLQRAGLDITPKMFWMASAGFGVVVGVVVFLSAPNMTLLVPLAAMFVGALGFPRWVVSYMIKRRQTKFLDEFANSIDVIVRGVKSGLPLNECLGIIAREGPSPIREEFSELVEQQRVGVPLSECFERMISRVPLPEVKFFAIVVAIQQQAGGNLSEALGNLSGVLRDRKRLQAKVRALSAEAKASAGVLGALPFIVMSMVYLTTPKYMAILWTAKMGQFLLLLAGVWMTMGLLVMRKMINFKY